MVANYGYKDGSGEFFITIDTSRCNGCGACAKVCLTGILVVAEDENDPLSNRHVATVAKMQRKRIKYACGPCKSVSGRPSLTCVNACESGVISHSW